MTLAAGCGLYKEDVILISFFRAKTKVRDQAATDWEVLSV